MLASARFSEAALSMTFLLNRHFMPFYKWAPRLAGELTVLGDACVKLLTRLADTTWRKPESGLEAIQDIEFFCDCVAGELRRQKLSDVQGNWLWTLGPDVQERIADPELRALNVMED